MSDLRAAIRAINNRVMLTVARAVVSLVDDSTKLQSLQLQLLRREIRDNVERFQNYGFTAKPHPGAEAVVVFVGGNRDHGLCIAVDDRRYRLLGLQDGEVALYTDEGDKIHLKRGNVIEVTTNSFVVNAASECVINSPETRTTGNLSAETGVTGSFSTGAGQIVTVQGGVITNIF